MHVSMNILWAGTLSIALLGGCDDNRNSRSSTSPGNNNNNNTARDTPDAPGTPGTYATPRTTDDDRNTSADPNDLIRPGNTNSNITNRADDKAGAFRGDAEVLGMLSAIDNKEIQATSEAMKRELSQPVMEFSKTLHTDHSANLEKLQTVAQGANITVTTPAQGQKLLDTAKTQLADMSKLNGPEFERSYINAMVQGHMDALSTIDNQLLPAAQNAAVKSHLTAAREHVAHHLKRAQEIRDQLVQGRSDTNAQNKTEEQK